jgi:hypothetical protein
MVLWSIEMTQVANISSLQKNVIGPARDLQYSCQAVPPAFTEIIYHNNNGKPHFELYTLCLYTLVYPSAGLRVERNGIWGNLQFCTLPLGMAYLKVPEYSELSCCEKLASSGRCIVLELIVEPLFSNLMPFVSLSVLTEGDYRSSSKCIASLME